MLLGQVFGASIGTDSIVHRYALIHKNRTILVRSGQDTLGADMQDAKGAGRECRVDDIDGTDVVDLPKMAALSCPELGICCEMINMDAAPHRFFNEGAIANIAPQYCDLPTREVNGSGAWSIENADLLSPVDEELDEMAANKSGTAGNEDGHWACP
jgi:hypothetical protein